MRASRHNKVIGLALGERSLLAAEVVAAGERPDVRQLAEFVYPDGVTPPQQPEAFGKALGQFLRERRFNARAAVVGLPARWVVVKPKEVPPADPATLAEMLRLQAEGEFSSELKDLVYDYAGEPRAGGGGGGAPVLLMATPQRYVDAAVAACEAANLNAVAVMPSAVTLGVATGRAMARDVLVLAVAPSGSELTAQSGDAPSAVRHLRGPVPEKPFVGELRRAVSMMSTNGTRRDLVLWDGAGLDAGLLGKDLGVPVQCGDLPTLGVDASGAARNGAGRKYAAAVALALAAIQDHRPPVDFLHSRLAPPKKQRVPRWTIAAGLAVVAAVAGGIYAYNNLQHRQQRLDELNAQLAAEQPEIAAADAFVSQVSFAQAWHGGNPRYLACLRDLTQAIPEDGQTYATSLIVRENAHAATGSSSGGGGSGGGGATTKPAAADAGTLAGQFYGKTSDQQRVQEVLGRMKRNPAFSDVKLGGTQDAGRAREVSFSITFTYQPPKRAAEH